MEEIGVLMERIIVSNIRSAYGRKKVLTDISFTVEEGVCAGIVGRNGCGKSTLLSIMAGVRKPDCGSIAYNGVTVTEKGSRKLFGKYTGYVPQNNSLVEELTVWDNLLLWYVDGKRLGKELEEGFLGILGLKEICREKVSRLSGGMKKRVSIGCALYNHPPILLLDEPGAALDLPGKAEVVKYLKLYRQLGNTIVLTTHDEEELSMCDSLYVMYDGKCTEINADLRGEELNNVMLNGQC